MFDPFKAIEGLGKDVAGIGKEVAELPAKIKNAAVLQAKIEILSFFIHMELLELKSMDASAASKIASQFV